MKRSQLVQIIREELEKNFAQQNIEDNLMGIVRGEKPQLKMGSQPNIKSIEITYTSPPQSSLYSIKMDGKKVVPTEAAIETIKNLTGLQLPKKDDINTQEDLKAIIDALREQGFDVKLWEMDPS